MHKRFKRFYSSMALTLSVAMIATGMPNATLLANAQVTEAHEAEAQEFAENSGTIDATDATTSTEATEATEVETTTEAETSAGAETTTEAATESTEVETTTEEETTTETSTETATEALDEATIQEYQTSKLKITKKSTSFYYGDTNVLVAEIGYAATTKDAGLGYSCKVIQEPFQNMVFGSISFNTTDPTKLVIDNVSGAPGKYTVRLTPNVPTGVKAESVDLTFTVKNCIADIQIEELKSGIYKPVDKAVSVKVEQVTCYDVVGNVVKNPKLTWYAAEDSAGKNPYDSKLISVKNGTVTLAKELNEDNFQGVYIIAKANDKPDATTLASKYFGVYSNPLPIKTLIFKVGTTTVKDGILSYQDYCKNIGSTKIVAYNTSGQIPMTSLNLTYTSSKPKEISVDKKGYITVHKVTGNPVKITVTAIDGSKQTMDITVKDTIESLNGLEFNLHYLNKENAQTFTTSEGMGEIEMYNYKNSWFALYTTQSVSNLKITKVKGAKDITSKLASLKKQIEAGGGYSWSELKNAPQFALQPTAEYIEVTFQRGKETKVVKFHNLSFAKTVNKSTESGKKIDTSMTVYKAHGDQKIKLYVGKQNAGGSVRFMCNADRIKNTGEYFIAATLARIDITEVRDYTIDKEGYVTFTFTNMDTVERDFKMAFGQNITPANKIKVKCCVSTSLYNGTDYVPYDVTITFKNPPKAKYSVGSKVAITAQKYALQEVTNYSKIYPKTQNGETLQSSPTISAGSLDAKLLNPSALASSVYIKETIDGWCFAIREDRIDYLAATYGSGKTVSEPIYVDYTVENPSTGLTQTKTEKVTITYKTK